MAPGCVLSHRKSFDGASTFLNRSTEFARIRKPETSSPASTDFISNFESLKYVYEKYLTLSTN